MTKNKIQLWTITIVMSSLFMITCKKDMKICKNYTELTDHTNLVDISPLNGATELLDTLKKYPELQVSRVFNDQYSYGMHCNVFYKGLLVFSDDYQLWKNKSDNSIYGDSAFVDTINISLTPSIQFDKAINIARQNISYDKTCISYRLGIFNVNSGVPNQSKNYKLTWKIQGENGWPFVILDAKSGQVYCKDDGIRQ